jgi:hypothetical protein
LQLTPLLSFLQQNAHKIDKITNIARRTPWMMASSENKKGIKILNKNEITK